MTGGPWIEAHRLPGMLQRRIPAPENLLHISRCTDQGGIAWRDAPALFVLLQGTGVVPRNPQLIVAEGLEPLRAVRCQRDDLFTRLSGTLGQLGCRRAAEVQARSGRGDS